MRKRKNLKDQITDLCVKPQLIPYVPVAASFVLLRDLVTCNLVIENEMLENETIDTTDLMRNAPITLWQALSNEGRMGWGRYVINGQLIDQIVFRK